MAEWIAHCNGFANRHARFAENYPEFDAMFPAPAIRDKDGLTSSERDAIEKARALGHPTGGL